MKPLPLAGWAALWFPAVGAWAAEPQEMAPPIDLMGATVQVVGYLILVIALLALAARLARRWQPGLGVGPVRLLGGLNLAPGSGVRLIQVGTRVWLLGVTRERITPIAELTKEDLAAMEEKRS